MPARPGDDSADAAVPVGASAWSFAFMRHGATDHNLRGLRCGGDVDVPLTEVGCRMVFELACTMRRREMRFGVILCGDLIRTRQSALLVSAVLGDLPIVTVPALNERHLGAWNGQPIAATEGLLADNETPPGGESEDAFTARVRVAFDQIARHASRAPLVVSSKGVGRVLNTLLGGSGRLAVGNGELVVFTPAAGGVELSRPLALS